MSRRLTSGLLIGGGLAAAGVAIFWISRKKSTETTDVLKAALTLPPSTGGPTNMDNLPKVKIHATGYWPYHAAAGTDAKAKKMEGGTKDRRGRPIHTLEQHLRDPVAHPYVSVAGDFEIWPDGQRISLSPWPNAIFRVVDTGGNFYGAKKVYRVVGEEPLDIAVDGPQTRVPKKDVVATIYPGDNWGGAGLRPKAAEKGALVSLDRFKDQKVS